MAASPPAWLNHFAGTPFAVDRFRSFVSDETVTLVDGIWKELRSESVPFSHWRWRCVRAPGGHLPDSSEDFELREDLRGYMASGGFVVIIGKTRAGKSRLLDRLMPGQVIDNSRTVSSGKAPVGHDDVPAGFCAVDETNAHDRKDVVRVICELGLAGRGLALVFQSPESFRDYGIAAHLAMQPVLFVNFVDPSVPV